MATRLSHSDSEPPSSEQGLDRPVDTLAGIGPKRAALLAELGILTVRDLLFYLPRDYQDRRHITPVVALKANDTATIEAEVVDVKLQRLRRNLSATVATLRDATGTIGSIWFGREYLVRTLPPGTRALFTGIVGLRKGLVLKNPEYEVLSGDEEDLLHTGRIVPIYRLTEGVSQRMLRKWIHTALACVDAPRTRTDTDGHGHADGAPGVMVLEDGLPEWLRSKHGFPPLAEAVRVVHYPDEIESAKNARNRFAYEELLGVQLGVLKARAARLHEEKGYRHVVDGPKLSALRSSLPFTLTIAQNRAVADILADMASPRPMVRLLQGDVGCGKTVVALHAVAAAADGGYQTALMVPTEILAEQHYLSLRQLLAGAGVRVELLTGSTPNATGVRVAVAEGETDVVVGTHALIQQGTAFHRLGLAIIDEQHRFGVMQRGALVEKGLHPDVLHMTATPIPRTLAITVYGGMDISVIDEMPPGRLPVKTRHVPPSKTPALYEYIRKQAQEGRPTYLVCPLIEESATREMAAVTTHFRELSSGGLAGLRVALLHGRMPAREKEAVMQQFKQGETDVLVSTSVIEVGIDCPTATTMVIEDAAQFGLTQLHQLRGRVGRGAQQSFCFLLGKPKTDDGRRRIEIMCRTTNGFEIAEADLEMRGPGEFLGVRQAGLSDLRVADLIRDVRLLDLARRDALVILEIDPRLEDPVYAALAARARRYSDMTA